MSSLQYFVGKVVTVFTVPTNRQFDKKEMFHYFLGRVDLIDGEGILLTQITTGLKSYFLFGSIVGIVQEEVDVAEEPATKEVFKESPNIFDTEAKCIDPSALSDMIEKIKSENN